MVDKRVNYTQMVREDIELYKRLQKVCSELGMSIRQFVRLCVKEKLEQIEKEGCFKREIKGSVKITPTDE